MKKAVIYARVSTSDQHLENQILEAQQRQTAAAA